MIEADRLPLRISYQQLARFLSKWEAGFLPQSLTSTS
jgi:hypothetical protein